MLSLLQRQKRLDVAMLYSARSSRRNEKLLPIQICVFVFGVFVKAIIELMSVSNNRDSLFFTDFVTFQKPKTQVPNNEYLYT